MSASDRRIAYPHDPLMAVAWVSCLRVSIRQPEVVAAYETDRGKPFAFARRRSPIEQMIDDATGRADAELDDFIAWFNVAVWGDDPFTAKAALDV